MDDDDTTKSTAVYINLHMTNVQDETRNLNASHVRLLSKREEEKSDVLICKQIMLDVFFYAAHR